jgi:hypothetical protein
VLNRFFRSHGVHPFIPMLRWSIAALVGRRTGKTAAEARLSRPGPEVSDRLGVRRTGPCAQRPAGTNGGRDLATGEVAQTLENGLGWMF